MGEHDVFLSLFKPTMLDLTLFVLEQGLLLVLGQPHSVIEDWTKSRRILSGDYICAVCCNLLIVVAFPSYDHMHEWLTMQAMKDYKPLTDEDLKKWELCDIYTEVSQTF